MTGAGAVTAVFPGARGYLGEKRPLRWPLRPYLGRYLSVGVRLAEGELFDRTGKPTGQGQLFGWGFDVLSFCRPLEQAADEADVEGFGVVRFVLR
jgi:hypothetical protein